MEYKEKKQQPSLSPFWSPRQTLWLHTHHGGGHAVHVLGVQVAFPVVGLHDPGQATVQGHVGLSVGGEDQQVWRIWTPTYLRLLATKSNPCDSKRLKPAGKGVNRVTREHGTLQTAAWMMASKPPSGASLFLDTICFLTSSVKRPTSSVRVKTCL